MLLNPMSTELTGRDIICFANDWDSDPLSKKHIMSRLARTNRILWVNSIGTRTPALNKRDFRRAFTKLKQAFDGCQQVAENITVLNPIAIPFHGNALARAINRKWLSWRIRRAAKRLGFQKYITWTFLPSTAGIAGNLGESLVIYHCVDEFSEFTGTDRKALLRMEKRLMQKADAVIVSSGPLWEAKKKYNPLTYLVTHGVDVSHFRQACSTQTLVPADLAALPSPVVGFFGLIADWVDLQLIKFAAQARPHYSFVLIGKIDTDISPLSDLANVHVLGQKKYSELPAYCKGFDVAVLPFVVNPLTVAANPLKLREYLAAGLPVVSTDIPEARRLAGLIRLAQSREEFLHQLDSVLTAERKEERITISQTMDLESWDAKVAELSDIVQHAERGSRLGLPVRKAQRPELFLHGTAGSDATT